MKYRLLLNISNVLSLLFLSMLLSPQFVIAQDNATETLPAHLQQWADKNTVINVNPTVALPPYDFIDTSGNPSGYAADFYQALAGIIPLRFEYGPSVNWSAQIESLENGSIDILANCSKTAERETKFLFTEPMVSQVPGLLVNLSNKELLNLSNWTSQTRLGAILDTSLLSYVKAFPHSPKIITASSDEAGVIQVASGDLDAFLTYQSAASYWARSNNLSTVSFLPIGNAIKENTYFCVRDGDPELVEIINWGIKHLDAEKLASIQNKWFSSDMRVSENLLVDHLPENNKNNMQLSLYMGIIVIAVLLLTLFLILKFKKSEVLGDFFGSQKLRSAFIATVLFICLAFILAILLAIHSFKNSAYQGYQEQLDIAQDGATTIIIEWVNEKKNINQLILTPELSTLTEKLITLSTKGISADTPSHSGLQQLQTKLLNSSALKTARHYISERIALNSSTGFFIISKNGMNLASMRDENVSQQNLLLEKAPQYLSRAWLGETILVPPVYSDVYFDTQRQGKELPPTMFILSPIINANGDIIALFAARLDPIKGFSNSFRSTNIGNTGEVYAVNKQGLMLSRNRYEGMMIESKELGDSLSSILSITMGNFPMQNILPKLVNSHKDINHTDYANYRHAKVLGSWRWIDKLGFAIVAEIDMTEVLDSYIGIRNLLLMTLFTALTTIIIISAFMLMVGRRAFEISTQSKTQLETLVDERTTELKNNQIQLAQSEQDNRLILASAPSAILVLDENETIQQVNQATTKLLGFQEHELLNRVLSSLFDKSDQNLVSDALKNYQLAPRSMELLQDKDLTLQNSQGHELHVEISMTPIDLSEGSMNMVAIRDITRSHEANRTLQNAQKLADDASQAKSDFLANMSHEIRTPMNAIIGMSYLALQTEMNHKAKNYIEKVNKAAGSLLGIINDILDFSKIEAGKMDLESIPFNINDTKQHISSLLDIKTQEKNLSLIFNFDKNIPAQLIGDPLRLNQIFLNLASNAVKFTEAGEIIFAAKILKQQDKRIKLECSVKDSGIGMSEQQKSRLFKSFSQADSSTTRKYGGTGLGLTICKRLTELMDGEIWVDSEPGQGSQIYFTCWFSFDPILEAPQPPQLDGLSISLFNDELEDKLKHGTASPHVLSNIQHKQKLAGAHILLVEDNELNQELATDLLSTADILVSLAVNGQQAMQMVQDNQYDAVLMDIQMPIMDGYTATTKIREFNQDIVIIAMTANAMAGDRDKVINAGMNDYISKPINVETMFATLATWISSNNNTGPLLPSHSPSNNNDASTLLIDFPFSTINTKVGLAICNEKTQLYQKLLQKILQGQANFEVQFREAWLSLQWQDATRIIHTLKGSAGNIGAQQLFAVAADLEHSCEKQSTNNKIEAELKVVCLCLDQTLNEIDDFLSINVEGAHVTTQAKAQDINAGVAQLGKKLTSGDNESIADNHCLDQLKQLQPQLLQAAQLLKSFDIAATDLLYELSSQLQDKQLIAQLASITHALDDFDFDKAYALLEPLLDN